jgi:hypothetical protein
MVVQNFMLGEEAEKKVKALMKSLMKDLKIIEQSEGQ